MLIVPGPLELTTEKLIEQILRVDRELPEVSYFHLDITDGVFVNSKTNLDIAKIQSLNTRLKFELHLMAHYPEKEMERWSDVKNVFRAIAHQEADGSIIERREIASKNNWQLGIALNPPTEYVKPDYTPDVVLFMTVNPGRQGAPFESTVLEKILKFTGSPNHPMCACDGHVNPETAPLLKSAGVEIFNVGSYFSTAPDLQKAYRELEAALKT